VRECPFCPRHANTAEHLYPQWISRHYRDNGGPASDFTLSMGAALGGTRRAKLLNQTVKVCGVCNNGWMSRLEERVRPVLLGLVSSDAAAISVAEQEVLSRWLFKSAVLHETLLPEPVSLRAARFLHADGGVPEGWSAHVAAAAPGESTFTHHAGPIVSFTHDGGSFRGRVRLHTMRFGAFASQVVLHSLDVVPGFDALLGGQAFAAQVWPPSGEVQPWPPGTILLAEWFDIVASLNLPPPDPAT
jgi:hypothetical protein